MERVNPETSMMVFRKYEAAGYFKLWSFKVLQFVAEHPGCIAREAIVHFKHPSHATIDTRFSELIRKQAIEFCLDEHGQIILKKSDLGNYGRTYQICEAGLVRKDPEPAPPTAKAQAAIAREALVRIKDATTVGQAQQLADQALQLMSVPQVKPAKQVKQNKVPKNQGSPVAIAENGTLCATLGVADVKLADVGWMSQRNTNSAEGFVD